MPLFAMYGLDKSDSLELRLATRDAHLAWIDGLGSRLRLAGPLLNAEGGSPIGSLIIIEADNADDARTTFANDPYAIDGGRALVTEAPGWGVEICPEWLAKSEYRISEADR